MRTRWLAVVLAWSALVLPLRAQEEKPITLPADGPEFFCHILFSKGLQPLRNFDDALRDPAETVIIIFGDPKADKVPRFLDFMLKDRFLQQGGNILIATDQRVSLPGLGMTITGRPVTRVDPKVAYRNNMYCPRLAFPEPNGDGPPDAPRAHPIFALLQQGIATNCPSHVHMDDPHIPRFFLTFPPRTDLDFKAKGFGGKGSGIRPTYIAVSPGDTRPNGRHLVIAGHGLFMNGMMLQADNDNFAFAINAVQWLRERPDGTLRKNALFVVDGKVIANFNMNLTPPPPPIPVPTVTMLNRLLRGLEDERFFHRVFEGLLGHSYDRVVPFLFTFGTCLLLLYGGKKFVEGRFTRDTGVPRMVGAAPALAPATPRGEQRHQALFRDHDPWEEARGLAEQWLQSEFGVTPEDWAAAGGAAEFSAAGFLWAGWDLQKRADHVLEILRGAGPGKVSRRAFTLLVQSLPELSDTVSAGRLTLLLDGKEVRQTSTT